MRIRRQQRGFTLVELLIAMAVFVIMSTVAYTGLNSTLDARAIIDNALNRAQSLQTAVFRIQSDLEQTVGRSIRDEFGDTQPALLGSADNGITFTRNGWRNPLQQPRSHLQRVGYRLDENGTLLRLHWLVLDRAQDSVPVETELLTDVETMEWRYLQEEDVWVERWPPDNFSGASATNNNANSAPPRAVELRLETEDYGEIRHLFYIAGQQ